MKDCAIQRTNTSGYNTAQAKEGVGLGKPDKLIVLGNGFTIDFLQHYAAVIDPDIGEKIDVSNLFRLGDRIKSPWDGKPGLLSYKNFPNLWTLGARPQNSVEESLELISEIITCANMFFGFLKKLKIDKSLDIDLLKEEYEEKTKLDKEMIYLKAYSELIVYLRCVFSHYNSCISDSGIKKFVEKEKQWGWIQLFREFKYKKNPDELYILTYNYDIWLERILAMLEIPFIIKLLSHNEDSYSGIQIFKPHGSINFISKNHKKCLHDVNYDIKQELGLDVQQIECQGFTDEKYDQGIIIPPLGDSSRFVGVAPWSLKLKKKIIEEVASKLGRRRHTFPYADVVLCGISYGYADRQEIDELLTSLYYDVDITQINPFPSKDLNAILTSLFRKYVYQTNSCRVKDILRR